MLSGCDAAKLCTENLALSPIRETFLKLFKPTTFIVWGSIRDDHREILEASVGLGDKVTVNNLQFIERLHAIGVSKYIALPQVFLATL